MNYFNDEEDARTVGEAIERSRARDRRGGIDRPETAAESFADVRSPVLASEKTAAKTRDLPVEVTPSVDPTTGYDMTDEEAAFRASDDDPEALGPADMRSSERIGGSRPYGSKGGLLPKGEGDAETVGEAIERSRERAAPVPMDDETTAAIEAMDDSFDTPDERAELFRTTPMGAAGTVHHRADGSVERTPPSPAAPDREYLLEAFGGNEVDDVPQDWGRDETGAMFARGGLGFDYDRTPTTMQGMDDAEATTRDRGTSLAGRGALVDGTLDMSRPSVQMSDGSAATVRSASFGTPDGEVLLPTISPEGAEWSDEEALDAYRAGGGHMGIYGSPEDATSAAIGIHESEAGEETYPVGEGFDDPETDAGMAAEPAPAPAEMTDFDALSALDGRIFEDGTVEGEPGIPGYDDLDAADMGITADDLSMERAGVSPDAAEIPGYPSDDDEDVEAAMGIDDDETAEMGGMELASPAAPGAKVPSGGDPSMRLDAGLPSEDDIAGAVPGDILRQIFGRIGRAAGGAIGHRPSGPIENDADRLSTERREGIRSRLDAKGETAAADRRSAAESASAERLASIRNEPTDLERSREARLAADAERASSLTSRRLDLTERGIAGEESEAARTAEESAARRDPASPQSDAARRRLRAQLDALASSPRTRPIADALGSGLDTMSADDVERIERGSMLRPLMGRGGGVGGGGGGGGNPTRDAAIAELVAEGMSRRAAGAEVDRGIAASRASSRRATAAPEAGEIIPGVRARPGIDLEGGEARAIRQRVGTYVDGYRALGEIEDLVSRYGAARSTLDPEVQAEIEPSMLTLISMVAAIQNSGSLNGGERPIITETLPDPSVSGMTLGRFAGALRGWRRRIEGATSSAIGVVAPGAESREAALHFLRTGEAMPGTDGPPATDRGPTVRVRDADGRVSSVPAEAWAELPEEERAGYEVVE